MDDSELFIGILAEEYSSDVNYEVRKAFNCFDTTDIFIFVKALKSRPKLLFRLIEWIKRQETVKYLEYTDTKDFKVKLMGTLMWKVRKIHKKLKIPFLD